MRTLKKTLCLVLVLAMMVGLCAMGANAISFDDYADKDAIMHKEAVALLSALEVLQGDANGFRGTDGLTRAEGAKIIAALLNANTAGLKSSFTDMGEAAWADGFVAYCEAIGIIAGYGDGTFGPSDKLTYAQFAKMLLVALGYNAEREEIYGGGWEIAVAKLVNQVGLSSGIADFKYGDPITRDDAAQMAFTALKTTMVGYNGNGLSVSNGQLANAREFLKNATYDYRADGYYEDGVYVAANDGLMQMIENYFPNFKLKVQGDDYGLNTNFWFKGTSRTDKTYTKAKEVAEVPAWIVLKTYTTNVALVSLDTLYKDGNMTSTKINNLKVIENGKDGGVRITPEKGSTMPGALKNYIGATVMLVDYNYDLIADELIVKYPLLAKVKSIIAAADSSTKERQVELTIYGPNGTATATTVKSFDCESFSKNEFVLLYPDTYVTAADAQIVADNFTADAIEITTVDSTIGTLDAVNFDVFGNVGSLTVDGAAYSVGSAKLAAMGPSSKVVAVAKANAGEYGLNKEITLYTSNGYILGVNTTATPMTDYVIVIGVQGGTGTTDLVTGGTSWKVAYAKQDGTVVNTSVVSDPATLLNKWCIATPKGDITIFTPAAAANTATGTASTLKSDTSNVGGIATNNNTNFVIRSGDAVVTVKAYAGLSSVPKFAPDTAVPYALTKDAVAVAVYMDFKGKTAASDSTDVLYVVSKSYDTITEVNSVKYYAFTAINAKGEKETLHLTADAVYTLGADARGLWVPAKDANGNITGMGNISGTKYLLQKGFLVPEAYKITADAGVITVTNGTNTESFTVANDATIWIWDGRAVKEGTLEDINTRYGHIAAISAADGSQKATQVFFYLKAK